MGFDCPLLRMFDHAVEERILKTENRALVLAADQPADLLRAMEEWRPAHIEKWLARPNLIQRRSVQPKSDDSADTSPEECYGNVWSRRLPILQQLVYPDD
jgi:hypothetical protein